MKVLNGASPRTEEVGNGKSPQSNDDVRLDDAKFDVEPLGTGFYLGSSRGSVTCGQTTDEIGNID